MHKVQTPNIHRPDAILLARSGEEPLTRREGSIGVNGRNVDRSSSNLLNIKSDSSLESIGVIDGFNNDVSNATNATVVDNSVRTSSILRNIAADDDNTTTTFEKRKVRWGPRTKAPRHGCGINSSGAIQFADLYKGIVDISSTLGKSAQQLGERIDVMGMACASEGEFLRGECLNAYDAACGNNVSGEEMGDCHFSKEDNSLIYSSDNPWRMLPETRGGIQESRDALDSYDNNMRESRQCFEESRYAISDGNAFIPQSLHGSMPSEHFTFNEYGGSKTNRNDFVASSSRAPRQKAQRSYFYSPSSNRASMNNIETGMGPTVNMMSPTFHRSPRTYGFDSPHSNTNLSPVSILKKNQSRYASSGTSAFPTTTGDARVKLRQSPRASNSSGKVPTPTSSTTRRPSPSTRGKTKKSRRVLGGLVKKSLKIMSLGTKSQLKTSSPKPTMAICASPSPRHSRY